MMTRRSFILATAAAAPTGLLAHSVAEAQTVKLFNGKDLAGWKQFVAPTANVDPKDIWSIKDGAIICIGQVNGYLITEQEYENYVFKVQWRWGEKITRGRNSGVFVHVTGPDKIWPKSIEAQLMSGRAGDFWLVDGFKLNIDAARRDPNQARHYYRMKDEVEKPLGEWNQYEITCKGNSVKLVVNGQLVNEGTESELTKGKILLQSEGAEVHFRNIELTPVK